MRRAKTVSELRSLRTELKGQVGLVPTMGALHDGHISLVQAAQSENDAVIATIFVNPTQFAPDEDLNAYPRDLDNDLARLEGSGVDVVFTPNLEIMYPSGFQTYVMVETVSQGLEGAQRPGHFRGVATVVAKLFNITLPTRAYFGQKDAQQVAVIRRMAYDLNFPLEIAVVPTVRESDGLAMSSRNAYLTPEQRQAASVLYRSLRAAGQMYEKGERDAERLRDEMRKTLGDEPLAQTEYVSVSDARTLNDLSEPSDAPLLLSMAVRIGRARLIDNCLLPFKLNDRDGLAANLGADFANSL